MTGLGLSAFLGQRLEPTDREEPPRPTGLGYSQGVIRFSDLDSAHRETPSRAVGGLSFAGAVTPAVCERLR